MTTPKCEKLVAALELLMSEVKDIRGINVEDYKPDAFRNADQALSEYKADTQPTDDKKRAALDGSWTYFGDTYAFVPKDADEFRKALTTPPSCDGKELRLLRSHLLDLVRFVSRTI